MVRDLGIGIAWHDSFIHLLGTHFLVIGNGQGRQFRLRKCIFFGQLQGLQHSSLHGRLAQYRQLIERLQPEII